MKTQKELKALAIKKYGNDPHLYGGQRDGFMEGYAQAEKDLEKNDWVKFEDRPEDFTKAAKNNYLCKFDDGTICRYNDEHPMAILTHFKK